MLKKIRTRMLVAGLSACAAIANAGNRDVEGYVLDGTTGEPLVGATISVKNGTQGCVANADGHFKMKLPTGTDKLTVSYVGMEVKDVEVSSNGGILSVRLHPTSKTLGEVLVQVAYGSAKKNSLIGSVGSVSGNDIEMRPTTNVTSALDGTVSGVRTQTSGIPGESSEVLVRGFSSVNGSNTPLYVVDGMPFTGNLSDINMADIESISVLKDAASAALYGNRASNGVILITTKKATHQKLNVKLSMKQGVYTRCGSDYERMGADDFMEVSWLGYRNSLVSANPAKYPTPEAANADASAGLISQLGYNIYNKPADGLFDANGKLVAGAQVLSGYADDLDWFAPLNRTGYRQEYSVSADGAGDKARYYVSLGYLNEDGYEKSLGYDRVTLRSKLDFTPRDWFNLGMQVNGSHQNQRGSGYTSGNYNNNLFYVARLMSPIYPVHKHDAATGEYLLDGMGNKQYDDGIGRPQATGRNIVWETELNSDNVRRNTLGMSAYGTVSFLNDFSLTVDGNLDLTDSERRTYMNATIGDAFGTGSSSTTRYKNKTYQVREQLNWQHNFNRHAFDAFVAHESFNFEYDYLYGYKTNEVFDGQDDMVNFGVINKLTGYKNSYRTESYLGRVKYNFDEKYFAEASLRRDGSSRFHKDNRWGTFWSAGAAWVISKEDFMQNVDAVDFLKFRASYGEVGNDAGAGYYGYMALYSRVTNDEQMAVYKRQNEANDIRWETTATLGIGLDTKLFGRWNLSAEYYDKRSKDLLFDVNYPLSSGANSTGNYNSAMAVITRNIGTMSNRGWEMGTDVDVIRNNNWKWNVGANVTIPWNKVVKLPAEYRKSGLLSGNWKFMEGHSMYEWWLTQFVGVDQMTGRSLYEVDYDKYYIGDNKETGKSQMPAADLVEINGNYYTTNASIARKNWSGCALPKVYGSLSTSVAWKDLSFSALMTYSLGGKMYDKMYASLMSIGTAPTAHHVDMLNAWNGVPEGMTEDSPNRIDPDGIPGINSTTSVYDNADSNRFLTSASYLSMKNITLSYSLPKAIAQRIDVNSVRLDLSVENAFYITKRKGLNPQESFDGSTNNKYAVPRIFSLGLTVKL